MKQSDQEFLRKAREQLNMTRSELAAKLDIDVRTVGRWETGDQPFPHIARLAIKYLLAYKTS